MNEKNYKFIPEINEYLPRVTHILKIISKGDFFEKWLKEKGMDSDKLLTEAGDIGTGIHNILERHGKGEIIDPASLKDRERWWFEAFTEWEKENIDSFLFTEKTVFNETDGYAGTLDSLVRLKTGKVALLDYKTSKYIYDTYYLQVAAYWRAFQLTHPIKVDTAYILRFSKIEGDKPLEVQEVVDLEANYRVFQYALKLWYWKNKKEK